MVLKCDDTRKTRMARNRRRRQRRRARKWNHGGRAGQPMRSRRRGCRPGAGVDVRAIGAAMDADRDDSRIESGLHRHDRRERLASDAHANVPCGGCRRAVGCRRIHPATLGARADGGTLGDRFGSRRTFSIGVLLFAIASAACALAQSLPQLLGARVAQGVAAALLVPSSLALLGATFSETERGRAIGTWSAFASLSGALGPLVGGWLIDHWSWRLVFLINLPLAVVTLAIVAARVPASSRSGVSRVDLAGAAAVTIAFGAITGALTLSSTSQDRAGIAAALGAAGLVAFAIFLFIEARIAHPMMPLSVWRSPTFAGVNALTLVVYAALAMLMFELPLYLIEVKGYPAVAAAAAMLPVVTEIFLLSRPSGAWASRSDPVSR